jgi:hypothetical protein
MDDEHHQPPSEERRWESTLLKLHEEFHQFMQECRDCRREIEGHWQFCAHCGTHSTELRGGAFHLLIESRPR